VFGRGAAVEGVRSSSPVESMPFVLGAGSSSPASPMSAAPQMNEDFSNQEWSDNSEGEERKGGRMNWTEEENLKLISSWLHHSNDSVKGNSQKGENFWKNIVAEFNSNVPEDRRRKVPQCKTHWTKTNKLVVHFNGCLVRMMRARASGESDDQVMANAHAVYKRESKGNKPFTLDYWWRAVKDQQKWAKRKENQDMTSSKRLKNNASGAYTSSSNQESEEASPSEKSRPEGQNQAKARMKGKEKKLTSDLTLESLKTGKMRLYHEATQVKAAAVAKVADAPKILFTVKLYPGSNNDLNVLNQSPLFTTTLQGSATKVLFTVNDIQYNMGYYLADGIYPEWASFVKTIPLPYSEKHKLYAKKQEAARKRC